MEDERIKSALELAMERISGLPELTPEEIAEQKEKEYAPIGTAIAVKYMNGAIPGEGLPMELNRYSEDQRAIVRRALMSGLCHEIRFDNAGENVKRAFQGMQYIAPHRESLIQETERDYFLVLRDFESAQVKRLEQFGAVANKRMKDLGIAGSAVRLNPNEDEEWKKELRGMHQAYAPKLEILINRLMREFS